jgi:fructose-bisphosphate aldolase class II
MPAQPLEENEQTRQAAEALTGVNLSIFVESELGDIGTGSEIHDTASETCGALTTSDEARQFVQATGVDALAPAIGNRHGMSRSIVDGSSHKHLDLARITEIKAAFVHVNTELRVAWRRGLEKGLAADGSEVVPYKILPFAIAAVESVV